MACITQALPLDTGINPDVPAALKPVPPLPTAIAVGSGGTGLSAAGTSGFIPVSNGSAWVMQAIDGGTYS